MRVGRASSGCDTRGAPPPWHRMSEFRFFVHHQPSAPSNATHKARNRAHRGLLAHPLSRSSFPHTWRAELPVPPLLCPVRNARPVASAVAHNAGPSIYASCTKMLLTVMLLSAQTHHLS